MARGNKAILIQLATGGGKSVVSGGLIKRALEKGFKSAFVVPRRELVRQMTKTYGIVDEKFIQYFNGNFSLNSEHTMSVNEVLGKLQYLVDTVNRIDLAAADKFALDTFNSTMSIEP